MPQKPVFYRLRPHGVALAMFAALALSVVLGGWGIYRVQADQFRVKEEARLRAIAALKADQVEQWLAERHADIDVLSQDPFQEHALRNWLAGGDPSVAQQLRRHYEHVVRTYHYLGALLLDRDGRVFMQVGDPHEVTPELLTTARRVLESGRVATTDLMLTERPNWQPHPHLEFVAPISNGSGLLLVLRADPEKTLYPLLRSRLTPSESEETLLLRKEGKEVLYLSELLHRPNAAMRLRLPISSGQVGGQVAAGKTDRILEGPDYRGLPVYSVGEPVAGTHWFVVSKIDEAEVLAPLRREALYIGILGLALLVCMSLVAFFLFRRRATARQLAEQAERLRQSEALRASERRFHLLGDQLPGLVWHKDRDGKYVSCNRRYAQALGIVPGEIYGRTDADFYPAELAAKYREDDRRVIETGQELDLEEQWPDGGSTAWVHTRKTPLFDDQGQCIGTLGVTHDISERKQAEAERAAYSERLENEVAARTADLSRRGLELEAANADLEGFSYSVSHDLRAPLRAIDGFVAILREDYAPRLDEEGLRLLAVVSDNARRMGQLIDDILAFSRAGRRELNYARLDMNALVAEVWREVVGEAWRDPAASNTDRDIDFRRADLPPAWGDPSAIRQVWHNLLANAIKFSRGRAPAVIEVAAEQGEGEMIYSVRDNGDGFSPDYAGKLFVLFQRLHGMDEFEGTGVGLAIVKRFVQKHGGRVRAEGRPGEGATFRFSMPVQP